MPTKLQLRRGTTSDHSSFTGAVGEVTVDTTLDTLVVHDGSTAGGFTLAKLSNISVTDSGGDGSLSYNSSTGVLTYTGPSASEVRAHITAGAGISVSSGVVTLDILDEDNMATDSATKAPSQQSVKAYVDSSISGISTTSLNTGAITYDDNEILGTRSNENILITPAGTGSVVISKLETGSINAPSTLSGTYTISSPTTITLSPTSEIINAAPMKLLGKTIAQLQGGFTASNGSMVAVSDSGHKPAYYDGSNWKYVFDNSNV